MKATLRRIGKALLWPLRRFFDPRFGGLAAAIEASNRTTVEATELLGRSVADVRLLVRETAEATEQLARSLAEVQAAAQHAASRGENVHSLSEQILLEAQRASGAYFERLTHGHFEDLDPRIAAVLDRMGDACSERAGLWFNSPVGIGYEEGEVLVRGVNERIAEMPYVFRGLAGIAPGASVLDVGAAESTVSLSLACLGYKVTAVDPRPYPLTHPRLTPVQASIETWQHDGTFDAVVCLSTIEHIGVGAYGIEAEADGADLAAMRRMRELTAPRGRLLLTTRYGRAGVDELQRTYDRAGLDALLAGWEVDDLTFLRRVDETTWEPSEPVEEPGAELVAMVTAIRPG